MKYDATRKLQHWEILRDFFFTIFPQRKNFKNADGKSNGGERFN